MLRQICSLVILTFTLYKAVTSQKQLNQNAGVRAITVNDGLPQGSVMGLAQDSRGFVWIASDGLSRFDGRHFVNFRHIASDSSTLLSNNIDFIRMDDHDNLWVIFGSRDVDVFNTKTFEIRHISKEANYHWLNPDSSQCYFVSQEGGQYFRATFKSLTLFNPRQSGAKAIEIPPNERLMAIGGLTRSRIFVSTDKSLYKLKDAGLEKIIDYPLQSKEDELYLNGLVQTNNRNPGRILVKSNGTLVIPDLHNIYLYNEQSRQLKPLNIGGQNMSSTLMQYGVYTYALTTLGLIRFDENGIVTRLQKDSKILINDILLMDRSGIVWAATFSAIGVRLFDFRDPNFRSYQYEAGFIPDALQPWFHQKIKNKIAFGSYEGRGVKDHLGNNWVINYTFFQHPDRIPSLELHAWAYSGMYKLVNNEAIKMPFRMRGWKINNATFDQSNQCWLIITDTVLDKKKLLVKLNTETGDVNPYVELPNIANENQYLCNIDGKICIVLEDELRFYDPVSKTCQTLYRKQFNVDGSFLMALPDIKTNNILWIATKGSGILQLNITTGKVIYYTEKTGLPNNTVYYIAADKKGMFWCSSNKGIFKFNPHNGEVTSFLAKDGLQGNEFNRFHFIESPDGHFIFGGTEGYTIFHPDSIHIDSFRVPVAITGVTVNNHPFNSEIKEITGGFAKLTLKHDQNILSISFAGLQFIAPDEVHYRYQLTGIDKGWVYGGKDTSAKYTFIPPGSYTFMVNASNTSGVWSDHTAKVVIIVLPPWWKTWWAYLSYLSATGVIFYALYRNWLYRAKDKQRIILHQKEAEQLKALDEMKSRFFSNITHEFRTPLSLIIAPLEQMQRENLEPRLHRQLADLQKNSEQLSELINQLLDMSKLEAKSMLSHLMRGDLFLFIQQIVNRFSVRANNADITLLTHVPATVKEHCFDADSLRKILQNLLSNAIKFTPAGGTVVVDALTTVTSDDADLLVLNVTDTGIGIPPDQLTNVFNRFFQIDDSRTRAYSGSGIGLALVKELTELLGGNITAINNASGRGTTFSLQLPISSSSNSSIPQIKSENISSSYNSDMERVKESYIDRTIGNNKPVMLVVEDHPELNKFIADLFKENYKVLTANNGKEGWRIAQEELPDIIISDMMMPEMDGIEFCQLVKNSPATSHIAFILLTAKASRSWIIEGLQNKADEYIAKPFHTDEILLRVANLLERQKQLQSFYNKQLTAVEQPLPRNEATDPFLEKVYLQIEYHLDDADFTVDQLARAVNVSARTLVRKLQSVAGISPTDLIKQYRLKKAAALLSQGNPVTEVAWSVGYSSRNYFSTAFKSFYGVSPSEYCKTGMNK